MAIRYPMLVGPPVREGEVLAGKYQVERILGQGGMGVVVAARHVQLGQQVALKFLLGSAAEIPEAVARFMREARAAVQIQSEHVARVLDVGQLESGAPYMVMEYLEGSDLAQNLERRGALPIEEAVGFVLQACEAIAEAHALGIVHRDLKPANLFLTQRRDGSPLVKVLDFGISKAVQPDGAKNLTATAAVMGSPYYMSPEQVRSARDVDARADVWALGAILQELVTAAPPFQAETASALFAMIIADPPTPLRTLRPDAPPALLFAVERCLEKDRARRFGSVGELARALLPLGPPSAALSVERISRVLGQPMHSLAAADTVAASSAKPAHPSQPGLPQTPPTGSAWGNTQGLRPAKRSALVPALALVVVVAAAGGGFLWLRAGGGPTTAASVEHSATAPPMPAPPNTTAPQATTEATRAAPAPAPSATIVVEPLAATASNPSSPPPPPRGSRSADRTARQPSRPAAAKPTAAARTTTAPAPAPVSPPAPKPPAPRKDLFDDTQ